MLRYHEQIYGPSKQARTPFDLEPKRKGIRGYMFMYNPMSKHIYYILIYVYLYIYIHKGGLVYIYIYGIDMYVYEYIYHFKQQSTRRLYRTIWDILSMYGNPNSFSVHVQYGYIN